MVESKNWVTRVRSYHATCRMFSFHVLCTLLVKTYAHNPTQLVVGSGTHEPRTETTVTTLHGVEECMQTVYLPLVYRWPHRCAFLLKATDFYSATKPPKELFYSIVWHSWSPSWPRTCKLVYSRVQMPVRLSTANHQETTFSKRHSLVACR